MTSDAPQQPLPDADPAFTPAGDADLAADPSSGRGPGGAPLDEGVELGSEADETEPAGSTDPDAPLDGGAHATGTAGTSAAGDAPGAGSPEKDPKDWVTGDEPMTGPQQSYLQTLAREAGEDVPGDLTKAEASETIDRLQDETGRGA